MGIKRIVDTAFWTDGNVDDFTWEDKYFMLYLLTNPFTTQLGIYEISIKQAAFQLFGYPTENVDYVAKVKSLIDRFENEFGIVIYSPETNEIAIKNFLRHSIIKGGKPVEDCINKEIKKVKNKSLIDRVFSHIKGKDDLNDTVKKIINEYCNEKNNDIHNDNGNDNDNDNEVSSPVSLHDSSHVSSTKNPPSLPQVIDFVKNNGLSVNPNRFFSYYDERNWKTPKGNPVDWEAKILEWDYDEKQKANQAEAAKPSGNPFLDLAKEENLI